MTSTKPFSQEEVAAVLREWSRSFPPSRFVVYGITPDPESGGYDGDVIAWGLAFDDHVTVQSINAEVAGRFSSAESMLRIMFRREADIRLHWIDREPPEPPDGTDPRPGV